MPFRPAVAMAGIAGSLLGVWIMQAGFEPLLPADQRQRWIKAWPMYKSAHPLFRYCFGILDGLFKSFLSQNLGRTFFLLVAICLAPLLLWLFQESNKPGRHPLMGPWLPFLVVNLGQLRGVGVVSTIVVPPVYALVKILEPAHQGIPSPPSGTFTVVNLILHLLVLASAATICFWPLNSPYWHEVNFQFQVSTLILFPLLFWPISAPTKGGASSSVKLMRGLKPVLQATWYVLIGWSVYSIGRLREKMSDSTLVIVYDTLGVMACFICMVLVDAANGDLKGIKMDQVFATFCSAPPAGICEYFIQKEEQGLKRAKVLKKTR